MSSDVQKGSSAITPNLCFIVCISLYIIPVGLCSPAGASISLKLLSLQKTFNLLDLSACA